MTDYAQLKINLEQILGLSDSSSVLVQNELTIEISAEKLLIYAQILRDNPILRFDTLIDVCGVDYLHYGLSEWSTDSATATGFSRAVEENSNEIKWSKPRFAVVYHLLSTIFNHRVRVKIFLEETNLRVPSVVDIWPCANWYEREAFDLFGILFEDHPDLRRLLTDYDFEGHPFRKDFPLIGNVEMRYDATAGRVVYEPVSIKDRTLVPKVVRQDNRYSKTD